MPSALSTSRKFSPAARTARRTCRPSGACSASGEGARVRASRLPLVVLSSRQGPWAGGSSPAPVTALSRRPTRTSPSRTTNWASPPARSSGSSGGTVSTRVSASRSTRAKRVGFSECAARSSPHTAAAARSSTRSPRPERIAPRVTNTSRAVSKRSCRSHSWTRARACATSVCVACGTSSPWPSPDTGTHTRVSAPVRPSRAAAAASVPSAGRVAWRTDGSAAVSGAAVHSRRSSESSSVRRAAGACTPAGTRSTSDSADRTGAPSTSTAAIETESSPVRATRTRTTEAPPACSDTPPHRNGSSLCSSSRPAKPTDCTAASSSAGCMP
ncbi:hypothetical protein APS67_006747 [Streptomyces sp. AVP053U2]|nr:hypothetical protein APS67_006747 [Streptomyces sp. AVP053U2]